MNNKNNNRKIDNKPLSEYEKNKIINKLKTLKIKESDIKNEIDNLINIYPFLNQINIGF